MLIARLRFDRLRWVHEGEMAGPWDPDCILKLDMYSAKKARLTITTF